MVCAICGSKSYEEIYHGVIRDGIIGKYTKEKISMYQCLECKTIWHLPIISDLGNYYESEKYRDSLEGTSAEDNFYKLHDKETMDKFTYTGTTVFRNKNVADVGCGAGGFLDFIKGVAKKIIAIEPSETYRKIMDRKGYETYPYAENAIQTWGNKIDTIVSFDVIEHVNSPREFLREVYEQKLLYSTQHLWILSENAIGRMAGEVGFNNIGVKYFQRYGIGNMLGWLKNKEPKNEIQAPYITATLDSVWKAECASYETSDYLVLYVKKQYIIFQRDLYA